MLCQDSKSIADILEKSKLSGFKKVSKKNTGTVQVSPTATLEAP